MQHRPSALFWLLLAATICLDAVVLAWQAEARLTGSSYVAVTFHALILGQLAVVSICCAMNPNPTPWTWLFPGIATALAALATALFTPLAAEFPSANIFLLCLGYFGAYVALLVASLWLLKRSTFWKKKTGVGRTFQYRVLHILILTTACGVFASALRNNPLFLSTPGWQNAIFIINFVALALATVVVHSLSLHWILRCALVAGCALLVTFVATVAMYGLAPISSGIFGVDLFTLFGSYYLIQAVVLWIWLTVGEIVPELSTSTVAGGQEGK